MVSFHRKFSISVPRIFKRSEDWADAGRRDRPVDVVRRGYDALSLRYRADDASPGRYGAWIAELLAVLKSGSRVLDLGCGCGVPVARDLVAAGHRVTGVDISDVQIQRARRLVPGATFRRADATTLRLPPGSFEAVVALYSMIHMPLTAQPALLRSVASWLVEDGLLLLSAGWNEWTGSDDGWLGSETPMWWSHADVATYRQWLTQAGLVVLRDEFVPEGDGGHMLFWARRTTPLYHGVNPRERRYRDSRWPDRTRRRRDGTRTRTREHGSRSADGRSRR